MTDQILLRGQLKRLLSETDLYPRQIMMSQGTFLELLDIAARGTGRGLAGHGRSREARSAALRLRRCRPVRGLAAAARRGRRSVAQRADDILETEREQCGAQFEAPFGRPDFQRRPHLRGITLRLVAGVQYLLLRSRKLRVFGGLGLSSDAGWVGLKASLAGMVQQMLVGGPPHDAKARSGANLGASVPTKCTRRHAAWLRPPRARSCCLGPRQRVRYAPAEA